jgi:stage V sporulation protein D (sporulation-specific penicillin-binding protein)
MPRENSVRIRIISIGVLLCALLFIGRLYSLQIAQADQFRSSAERQYINTNTVSYDRGEIFFESRTGELLPAAMTRSGFTLAVNPSLVKDPEGTYAELNSLVPLVKSDFLSKVSKKSDPYEELEHKLNNETADKVRALKLPGIILAGEKWRFYPRGESAARVIGFVSYKGDQLIGNYGLERYYEDILRKDPSGAYKNFFAQMFGNIQNTLANAPAQGNLVTTIEPSVQIYLDTKLKETRARWSSEFAGGIIVNPMTGAIYAMSADPSFDLNDFKKASAEVYGNPMVENVYEMGSIVKALTMAAGLDSGTVTAKTTYHDAGFLELNKKRIQNYDGRGRGVTDMQQVLNQSLNTGAAYVALKMGNSKFAEYMRSYGIDTETGIDLPNETKGLSNNLDSTRAIEMVTASYGQGIAMTPVETVRALSTLANGGKLVTPHLVKRIEYPSGLFKKISMEPGKQVLKPETSEEISRMLVGVVDDALAGGKAKLADHSIAAKTGTAQMSDEGTKGYVEGKYLHSFFGYFPAYDPQFLVFLFHTYPKGVKYASETLTEPFMDITKFLINYYEIPPDRGPSTTPPVPQ